VIAEQPRRPARYHEDHFRYTSRGHRWSEVSDAELLLLDPSRAAQLAPPPLPADEPDDEQQPPQ
jgi:hypothetical protein